VPIRWIGSSASCCTTRTRGVTVSTYRDELTDYGWCELRTPFGFTIGLSQTEEVTPSTVVPTFGLHDGTSWRPDHTLDQNPGAAEP
jgi:hypothetical protein